MIPIQNVARRQLINPGTIFTSATSVSNVIDRRGFFYALASVSHQPATATNSSAQWTSFKWQESDNSTANFTDITSLTGGTSAAGSGFLLPTHNDTANVQVIQFRIDLRGRKRYLRTIQQAGASHNLVSGEVILDDSETSPSATGLVTNSGASLIHNA